MKVARDPAENELLQAGDVAFDGTKVRPGTGKPGPGRPKGKKNKESEEAKPKRPRGRPRKSPALVPVTDTKITNPIREISEGREVSENEFLERWLSRDHKDKVINENPIDPSYLYRGSKNIPTANAKYEFSADMVAEIKKCTDDIFYFAENYFFITNVDEGKKQKIALYPAQKRALKTMLRARWSAILASRQCGKALALNTPVRTTTGFKMLGDIVSGDVVFGSDGTPTTVTHAHEVMVGRPCYKITFDSGEQIIVDEDHEWLTQSRKERQKGVSGSVKTAKQIFDTPFAAGSTEPNHRIPMAMCGINPDIEQKDLPIDPYVLGLWLGDGAADNSSITVGKRDLQHTLQRLSTNKQFDKILCRSYPYCTATTVVPTVSQKRKTTSLTVLLKKYNLHRNKHIPEIYFGSSRQQKLELLSGLMDSDGHIDKRGMAEFSNTNHLLALGMLRLVRELGYKGTITDRIGQCKGIKHKTSYQVRFKPREQVACLPFKADRIQPEPHKNTKRGHFHYIVSIEPCESVPVRCLTVDSKDHLYLAGRTYIPTHNSTLLTVIALWFTCFKTDQTVVIIANKESTAINIFRRVRMAYEQLPNFLKPGVKEYAKTGMTLANDSIILVSTTTATAARGASVSTLLLDELAFIPREIIDEFWSSVIPTISSGKKTKIIAVSTSNGVDDKFYEIYSGAEKGENGWASERIDWWDVPGRSEKWKQDMVNALGSEETFSVEFGNAFLDNSVTAVGAALIEKFKREKKLAIWTSAGGEYKIYEAPDPSRLYIIGVDVGEGIGRASSVAQVLDVTNLYDIRQVAVYGSAVVEPYQFAAKLNALGHCWGIPPMLIERNNCGAQVIDALYYTYSYEKIVSYSKITEDNRYLKTRNLGVLSHNNIRFTGIQNMRYWINHLQVVKINDPSTISEFETFVRYPNGFFRKKNENFYDDRVLSITWALFILHEELVTQWFEVVEYDNLNKPSKIQNNNYFDTPDPSAYKIAELEVGSAPINPASDWYNVEDTEPPTSVDRIFGPVGQKEPEEDLDDLLGSGYIFT